MPATAVAMMIAVHITSAFAQQAPAERSATTYEEKRQQSDFTLPEVVDPGPQAPLSQQPLIFVHTYRVVGNTVLPEAELTEALSGYLNRQISTLELQELRRVLTLLYTDAGYVNSGVVIPDQDVTDGVIEFRVVEGRLTDIQIGDTGRFKKSYIRDRVQSPDERDQPLNVHRLHGKLLLLRQDPLIDEVSAQLAPGLQAGESTLHLNIEENEPPYRLGISFDNRRNPAVGSFQGSVNAAYRNFTGYGDIAAFTFKKTEGLDDFDINYSIPINRHDTNLFLQYRWVNSEIVEEPLDDLGIKSEYRNWVVSLSHPVLRTTTDTFRVGLTLENRTNQSFLFDEGLGIAPGEKNDGRSSVTPLRLVVDWLNRRENQVIALRSTISGGLDAFGATINDTSPDGRFLSWLGQLQLARRFQNGNQLILRGSAQLADTRLLPVEKFGVGGALTVRGYRQNQFVRDNGIVASAELRFPPKIFGAERFLPNSEFAVFYDWGQSWNKGDDPLGTATISSAGLGFRWDPTEKLNGEIYFAYPFDDLDTSGNDFENGIITFRVSYDFF